MALVSVGMCVPLGKWDVANSMELGPSSTGRGEGRGVRLGKGYSQGDKFSIRRQGRRKMDFAELKIS